MSMTSFTSESKERCRSFQNDAISPFMKEPLTIKNMLLHVKGQMLHLIGWWREWREAAGAVQSPWSMRQSWSGGLFLSSIPPPAHSLSLSFVHFSYYCRQVFSAQRCYEQSHTDIKYTRFRDTKIHWTNWWLIQKTLSDREDDGTSIDTHDIKCNA